jgi:phosphatidylserine/phosphatidylglycerophosphate/cardiolipin synthase-like enzyme
MLSRAVLSVALIAAAAAACRTTDGNSGDDGPADAAPDGVNGVGCSAMTPRDVPVEAFVGPTGLQARMTALIDSATTTLDVHMYLWTVKPLADRIVAAKQRGVQVRVILDPDEAGNNAVEPIFASGGVTVRQASALYTFSHAKYLIVDRHTASIMSMNFNVDAMNSERNYGVIDKDPEDVSDLIQIFEMDWAAAGGEPPKPADLACTRLVVSPNNSKMRLVELVNSAKSTLELEVLYLSETNVRNAVGEAKGRGVDVRVILEDPTDSSVEYLTGLGIPVKFPPSSIYLHSKLIIADGVAFVGSENMSQTSLTKNREVGVFVTEPAAQQVIETAFESDWTASHTQ